MQLTVMKGLRMKIHINGITGIDDAIVSMFLSKRKWCTALDKDIRDTCSTVLGDDGGLLDLPAFHAEIARYNGWMDKLLKIGKKHITLLRFIDISVTVEGLHRGGQDDWDSHAKRFDNRIVRASTRLAEFTDEKSDWYEGKIITTDDALKDIGYQLPDEIELSSGVYKRAVNGYVREDLEDNCDAKRGLYMLSIPSNFIFKINLCEFAHVYKMRNENTTAHPEVRECCEAIATKLEELQPKFTRALLLAIEN